MCKSKSRSLVDVSVVVNRQHSMKQSLEYQESAVRMLAAITFVIFFQAYMVAPLIPTLATAFGASARAAGFVIPVYLIPYGIATLFWGLLSDRIGVAYVLYGSLAVFVLLTAVTATSQSLAQLIFWRGLTGLGASGVVPLALVLVGRLFPYEQRGRPLGWLFGAMAGGMAFGSTFGAILEPFISWRGVFVATSAAGLVLWLTLWRRRSSISALNVSVAGGWRKLLAGYRDLLHAPRGLRTYVYVFINALFHSGVFTWLAVYLKQRYGLGEIGIGLALLGYGIPGFFLGPAIGRAADRLGRARLLPAGIIVGALSAAALILNMPLIAAAFAFTFLSLGYDMAQPLLAGIVTTLGGSRPGQTMGLNVFALFVGFGVGSLLFGEALRFGFPAALALFATVQLAMGLLGFALFHGEHQAARPL